MSIDLAAAGYLAGWKILGKLPPRFLTPLFNRGANLAATRSVAVDTLAANLARVVGASNVTDDLLRASMRSYARYWQEVFCLPTMVSRDESLRSTLLAGLTGFEHIENSLQQARGVVLTLPHSGNWDMAGVTLTYRKGSFTTVAERLKPEVLFNAFLDFRQQLGFHVIPLTGGATRPFDQLRSVLEEGGIVALLGERDLKGSGVPVNFFGEETTFPAGPAQLALETGAALHVVHSSYPSPTSWSLECSPALVVDDLDATIQRIADGFAANIARHPADWHMLQPIWPSDRLTR